MFAVKEDRYGVRSGGIGEINVSSHCSLVASDIKRTFTRETEKKS